MSYGYLVWALGAVVVASALLALVYIRREQLKKPDGLQTLGTALVVLGVVFGVEDDLMGYSLIGAGVLLSLTSLAVRRLTRP